MRLALLLPILLCALAISPPVDAKKGDTVFGIGPDAFFDDGSIELTTRTDNNPGEQTTPFTNDHYFTAQGWALTEVVDDFRLGGQLRYFGAYEYTEDEDDSDDPEVFRLGPLIELSVRAEYLLTMVEDPDFDFVIGLELGMALLVPDGRLESEIDNLQGQGIDAWSVPRLGYVVGPQVGFIYRHSKYLGIRLDFGFKWEQLFLFAIDDEVSGVAFERFERADIMRVHFGISIEVAL